MDLLFLVFLLVLAGFFLLVGSWRGVALVTFIGVTFLALSSFFVLSTGVEVVNGTNTTYSDYSVNTTETGGGVNTTIFGSKIIANTYARLDRFWEMSIVTILLLLCTYLSYGAWVNMNAKSDDYY
jgi:hypothetical protein